MKPEGKVYYKREANGFTVKVWPTGVKTWCYIYTFDGKRKEMKLGEYPAITLAQARARYNAAYDLHQKGTDPGAVEHQAKEERRKTPTVADLADEYIKKHAMPRPEQKHKGKKSWEEDKRALDVEVIPAWGKRKAKDITKRDVVLLLEGVIERGAPVMANRLRALLSKMFNFGIERDIIELNPCTAVKPLAKEHPRERVLDEEEIKTLWDALDSPTLVMSTDIRRALKLIQRVLNHTLEKLDATYNQHDYDEVKQAALETLERKIQQIITGKGTDNVVSITTAKGDRKAA